MTIVSSGVTSSGLTVSDHQTVDVLSGGDLIDSTILRGGIVVLSSGASASGLHTVGGVAVISGLDEGAQLFIDAGATATGTVLRKFISNEEVYGVASGTIVSSGAELDVDSGGVSYHAVVSKGGYEFLRSGGATSGDTILGGGLFFVDSGGAARGVTASGGTVYVAPTGMASGTVLNSADIWRKTHLQVHGSATATQVGVGGYVDIYLGGLTRADLISSGGHEFAFSGGVAKAVVVGSGGVVRARSGGATLGAHVESGGNETILSGGTATATVVSGGYEFDYGLASGTVIRSGGHEEVEHGGIASGSVVSNGGREIVSSGGLAIAANLFNGGTLIVASSGSISGGLTIHAGQATIEGAMAAGQTVTFAGTVATLRVDNLSAFGAAISGFGGPTERIDLGGFAFAGGETATWSQTGTSGTLTVHDGATSGSLTLVGTYATGDFALSTDSHGGTLIREPTIPGGSPATARFTQAVAGLEGGRSAAGVAAIHGGGGSALIGASLLVGVATSGR